MMSSSQRGVRRRQRTKQRNRRLIFESLENRIVLSAVRMLDGFDDNTLPASDDGIAGPVDLGFAVDFFGSTHTQLFVNNNGNVTFGSALPNWTSDDMREISAEIIAPFWADVDTRDPLSGLTTYGADTVNGRDAFGVNWIDVGSFNQQAAVTNSFQLVLIDRSDIEPGAFDVEFNYDSILWDTFDTVFPDTPESRAGFSAGSGDSRTYYELIGSGFSGTFLDNNPLLGLANNDLNSVEPGRYTFHFRSGTSLDEHGLAGQAVEVSPGLFALGSGINPDETPIAQPTNADAADTINTDRLRAGGELGLNLSGSGLTVGVWEADACYPNDCSYVLGTHQELTGRVAPGDIPGELSDHATHVAGTIGATGLGADGVLGTPDDDAPRGMANQVQLLSYDTTDYVNELRAAIATQGIVASNHSWGYRAGWDLGTFAALGGGGQANSWASDRSPSVYADEDPDFGQYNNDSRDVDDVLFDNPGHLAVFAAGNDGPRPLGSGSARGHYTNHPVSVGGVVLADVYASYFSSPPVAGFADPSPAWWLVSTSAVAAPPDDGNGGSGFDNLPAGGPTAKNTLTVGAVEDLLSDPPGPAVLADFTSWGPTDDGRIKPDVVANGVELFSPIATANDAYAQGGWSGTSMAAASATGAATLLVEHYQNLHAALPISSTVKGAVIHTARDAGTQGPDGTYGWGVLDAAAAAEFLTDEVASGDRNVRELIVNSLPQGGEQTVSFELDSSQPLKATLVWTDPAGTARTGSLNLDNATPALVNDLDLTVSGPGGTFFPWRLDPANPTGAALRSGRNDVDNVEQVLIDIPSPGTYTIRVDNSGVLQNGSQAYSLLISAAAPVAEDRFELNNSLAQATVLGSEPAVTLRDLSIHDVNDVDFFRTTASVTGKLVVNALFDHAGGDLDLQIRDARGNVLASANSGTDNEQLVIPVVSQAVYYVEVLGLGAATNEYSLEIENFAAPLVDFVDLPARDQNRNINDTGISNRDDVTNRLQAELLIEADLSDFAADGIAVLTRIQAEAMDVPGAAVEVFVNGNSVGYAEPIAGTGDTLFRYTFADGVLPVEAFPADSGGWLQYIKGAVRIIDGQRDILGEPAAASARTQLSQPLLLRTDTAVPAASTIQLLPSSDSGIWGDGITNVNPPAFAGVAEVGAIVFVYADAGDGFLQVGRGVVGTDETDGTLGNDLGTWEVTIEPLADGEYVVAAWIQDAAGNLNVAGEEVTVSIDTLGGSGVPQRPTIDLLAASDTGMSDRDNVTIGDPNQGDAIVDVRVTGDAGSVVDVKDGNTVIATFLIDASQQAIVTLDFNVLAGVTGFPAEGPHRLSAEATDAAGNRSAQSTELPLTIDFTDPAASPPNLLASSDSGAFSDDNVTGEAQPAFRGAAQANARIRVFADGVLVGQGVVNSDESDGDPTNGQGVWEVTVEPLDDAVYEITTEVEDLAGNITASNALQIEIDTIQPNTPQLTLLDDTGHSDVDNITADNTPLVSMTTQDANVLWHEVLFTDYLTFRLFDRFAANGGAQAEFLLYDSALDTAVDDIGTAGDGLTRLRQILETLPEQYGDLNGDNPPALIMDLGGQVVLADGAHQLKLEVEDRAGNISHDFLLTIYVDTAMPDGSIDLLASSDTGFFDDDNVTSLAQPAFSGLAETNTVVRVFADNVVTGVRQLIGQGIVGSDLSDAEMAGETLAGVDVAGAPDDGLGLWEVTVEPLADGVYEVFAEFEDRAGNVRSTDDLRIEIDTSPPNTPLLDLAETSDSGRHDDDNITRDNAPEVTMSTHDANAALHPLLFQDNLWFRIWDRFEGDAAQTEFLLYDSSVDALVEEVTVANDHFTSLTFVRETLPELFFAIAGTNGAVLAGGLLADGIHNLKLEVEDRAGNVSQDFLLDLLVDTQAFAGEAYLHPDSDTGIWGYPATMTDGITADKTPAFFGIAEANNIVMVLIDGTPAGTTVAVPLDGDDAFQPPDAPYDIVQGNWLLESNLSLADGEHVAEFIIEDPAGNRAMTEEPVRFFVDSQGPRIANVTQGDISFDGDFTFNENTTSLFHPKPDGGPDPLISSIAIHISDLPPRSVDFDYTAVFAALAEEEGNYRLVGDANGNIPILEATVSFDTPTDGITSPTAIVELVFHNPGPDGLLFTDDDLGAPLPDDRYTLTVLDALADPAGNPLDGESPAAAPFEGNDVPDDTPPAFPTGDGRHGGDFLARFTVDARPEIGDWSAGSVYLDLNGNFTFDPANIDYANRDVVHTLGYSTDYIFAGDFPGNNGAVDGYDKLAAYGRGSTGFRWLFDTTNDGVANLTVPAVGTGIGSPIAGDFAPGIDGDEVGLFTGTTWYFYQSSIQSLGAPVTASSAIRGLPFVGDFDGDGLEDVGTLDVKLNAFTLSLSGSGGGVANAILGGQVVQTQRFQLASGFPFIGPRERPVAADMDGDGIDDIGLWVPDRSGATPEASGEWYFIVSAGKSITQRINPNDSTVDFNPAPFGADIFAQFGDHFALPVVGNFDPPVTPGSDPAGDSSEEQPTDEEPFESGNASSTGDASDATGESTDATQENETPSADPSVHPWQNPVNAFDVNRDGHVTPWDILLVANWLSHSAGIVLTDAPGDGGEDPLYVDTSGDDRVTPLDALLIVNFIEQRGSNAAEGEGRSTQNGVNSPGHAPAANLAGSGLVSDLAPSPLRFAPLPMNQIVARQAERDAVFARMDDELGWQELEPAMDALTDDFTMDNSQG